MNKVQIRDALVGHLETLLAQWDTEDRSITCVMDNQDDLDLTTVGSEFMCFDIAWYGTKQTNVAENPDHRYYGDVIMILFGKVGTGTRSRLVREDEITEHFKFKALGGVTVQPPTLGTAPDRHEKHDGWDSTTVAFPFFADSHS